MIAFSRIRLCCLGGAFAFTLGAALLTSCGGGSSNFSDIRGTATAAAALHPSPSATVDLHAAYISQQVTLTAELRTLLDHLTADLLAAQASQSDPKWPGVLTADLDLVSAKAAAITAVPAPTGLPSGLADRLAAVAASASSGAAQRKTAVQNADAVTAAKAVQTLDGAGTALDSVRTELAALAGSPTPTAQPSPAP